MEIRVSRSAVRLDSSKFQSTVKIPPRGVQHDLSAKLPCYPLRLPDCLQTLPFTSQNPSDVGPSDFHPTVVKKRSPLTLWLIDVGAWRLASDYKSPLISQNYKNLP